MVEVWKDEPACIAFNPYSILSSILEQVIIYHVPSRQTFKHLLLHICKNKFYETWKKTEIKAI